MRHARRRRRRLRSRFQLALRTYQELGHRLAAASTAIALGAVAIALGGFGAAETAFELAFAVDERFRYPAGMARSLDGLGRIALSRGDYEGASSAHGRALQLFEQLDDPTGTATTLSQLGLAARATGDYNGAENLYRRALGTFARVEHRPGMANSYLHLGALAEAHGEPREADERYRQALELYEQVGNRDAVVTTLRRLADVHAGIGNGGEAVTLYTRTLAVGSDSGTTRFDFYVRPLLALRAGLDEDTFTAAARRSLDENMVQNLISDLDELRSRENPDDAAGDAPRGHGPTEPPGDDPLTGRGDDPQIINIWVREREAATGEPLVAMQPYTLSFRVGLPQVANLASGPAAVFATGDLHHETYAYDWRRPLRAGVNELRDEIVARSSSLGGPIHLVAHSMGGLLLRAALMAHPELRAHVGRVVFVGTPHFGSPVTLRTIYGASSCSHCWAATSTGRLSARCGEC